MLMNCRLCTQRCKEIFDVFEGERRPTDRFTDDGVGQAALVLLQAEDAPLRRCRGR